jgi:hypothetical protein
MFTLPRISSLLLGLFFLSGSVFAGTLGLQGDVKGPDGKAIKGANVSLQLKGTKAPVGSVKTDQQGRFTFKNLALGQYSLVVTSNGMATASVENVKTRADGAVEVNFKMIKQVGSAQAAPAKVKRERVWVQELGSNLGHWEDVGEATGPGTNPVHKGNAATLQRLQDGTAGAMADPTR